MAINIGGAFIKTFLDRAKVNKLQNGANMAINKAETVKSRMWALLKKLYKSLSINQCHFFAGRRESFTSLFGGEGGWSDEGPTT